MSEPKRDYNKYAQGMVIDGVTLIERLPGGQKWKMICACGCEMVKQVKQPRLKCKHCREKETPRKVKHGESNKENKTRLYRIWLGMLTRCKNPRNHSYKYYGSVGISICKEWDDSYIVFRDWALANGYDAKLSIDRIDVYGDYTPENCRWVDAIVQGNNRRNNHYITIDSITHTVMEWCRSLGLKKTNLYTRAKKQGITVEEYLERRYRRDADISMGRVRDHNI